MSIVIHTNENSEKFGVLAFSLLIYATRCFVRYRTSPQVHDLQC